MGLSSWKPSVMGQISAASVTQDVCLWMQDAWIARHCNWRSENASARSSDRSVRTAMTAACILKCCLRDFRVLGDVFTACQLLWDTTTSLVIVAIVEHTTAFSCYQRPSPRLGASKPGGAAPAQSPSFRSAMRWAFINTLILASTCV